MPYRSCPLFSALEVLLVAALPLAAGVGDSLAVVSVRNHFEWGEYDSLIAELTPLLAAAPGIADSPEVCRYRLYLGVAYFASGNIPEARRQFEKGVSCDSSAILDRRYASEEIFDFFTLIRTDYRRKMAERDSLARLDEEKAVAARKALEQAKTTHQRRRSGAVSAVFWGSAALLASGGAIAYLATRDRYDDFLLAAREGDRRAYEQRRSELQVANVVVAAAAAGSVACGGVGLTVTVRMHSLRGQRSGQ